MNDKYIQVAIKKKAEPDTSLILQFEYLPAVAGAYVAEALSGNILDEDVEISVTIIDKKGKTA